MRLTPLLPCALLACRMGGVVVVDDTVIKESEPQPDSFDPRDTDTGQQIDTIKGVDTEIGGDTTTDSVPPADDPEAILWDESELQEFRIYLDADAYEALANDPYTYVQGRFEFRERSYEPVGVRIKGQGSYLPITSKPSLKIKFDEYNKCGEFLGLEDLTLNNMSNDYSMMHERVAYTVYRWNGIPASQAMHCLVYVNDIFYGVYTNLENAGPRMLDRWFEDNEGTLYELWDVDFYDSYVSSFQHEAGKDDRTAIQGLTDALEKSGETALEEAQEWLDLDEFISYWATGAVLARFDAYPYTWPGDDCHLYVDPADGKIHFIPWGADETFYYPDNHIESINGILAQRCLAVGWCQDEFRARVWEVWELCEDLNLAGYFDTVSAQVSTYVRTDTHKPYSTDYVWSYQRSMQDFIDGRHDALAGFIGEP